MTDTTRVLTTIRKLRRYATADFILDVTNRFFPDQKALERTDVQVIFENLLEDGLIENRIFENGSFWRIKSSK